MAKKSARESTKSDKARKSSESAKGKGKGKKGGKGKTVTSFSDSIELPLPPPPPPSPSPSPPPAEPTIPICNDKIQPLDSCRYTSDGCCKEEVLCRPNHYPGLLPKPETLAVAGSESGTYDSVCKLLRAGFLYADRVLAMTPWGNYVTFRAHSDENKVYFLFDGCTCNVNRFRYMDLNCGTAGLLYFTNLHDVLSYIMESRETHVTLKNIEKINIDEVCKDHCKY